MFIRNSIVNYPADDVFVVLMTLMSSLPKPPRSNIGFGFTRPVAVDLFPAAVATHFVCSCSSDEGHRNRNL
jgi:hypothetical protein